MIRGQRRALLWAALVFLAAIVMAARLGSSWADEAPKSGGAENKTLTCATPLSPVSLDSGIVTVDAGRRWQPPGGEISLSVKPSKAIPSDATVLVCFRWQTRTGKAQDFKLGPAARVAAIESDRTLKLAVTIPSNLPDAPRRFGADAPANGAVATAGGGETAVTGVYEGFMLVPMADVRILISDSKGGILVDASCPIGVTDSSWAALVGIGVAVGAFVLLGLVRLFQGRKVGTLLRLIATPGGYASLSQFQIMLWTFVVGGSAAYVMALFRLR